MCSGNGEPRVSEALLDAAVDTSIRTIEALEEKVANQEKELAELRPATAQALQENAVLRATVDRLERELQDHVDAIAGLTIDKTNLELDLQDMRGRADTLAQEASNLEAVLEKQYQSAAELVLQRDEARSKLRVLQAETDPAVGLLAYLQGLYAVTTAKEVEEAVRQDKQTLAGLSEELELAHRDLEKKDRLVDQIRKAAAENRRQLEVVTADRDEKALTLEQAKARATADTVEVGQLITQRVELVERAKSVARSAGLPAPTDLKAVEEFLVDLAVARNEARNALDSKVQDLTADRDRLLAVGRELAERFPGNPPESLKDLAGLLTEVLAKEEERVGVLNGHQELSKRRDQVMKAGRELARAHGEEPPEDLQELATLLGQLARQESSDGLPGREALLRETREQRETIHSLAHEVDKWKHKGGESLAELVEARNELRQAQAEAEQLATELDGVRETVKDLQVRLHGAQEAHDLRMAEVEDLKGRLADQDKVLREKDGALAALRWETTEKDKTLATLQEFYEVSKWTDLPAASAILHRRFGEIVQERDQLRREKDGADKALQLYRQERDELAQRLRTQAAADQGGDRQELAYLRGELKLVQSALLEALGQEAKDPEAPVVPVQLRDMVVQLRSMMGHHKARDERLSQELDNRHFDTQELEALRSERDRLAVDRDRLLQAERLAVQEADHLRVELSQARDLEREAVAKLAKAQDQVEEQTAQRAALKVERDHLARELAETTVAEGRASSAAQDLSSHLDGALAEMERLSQRFLESEAERFDLWSERMAWSTDQTRLLGQVKDLKAELAETKSSLKNTSAKLAATLEEERSQADEFRHQAEVAAHALTRVCLEDVDIVRDGLERCGCEDCTEALRRLVKVGYLPVRRSKRQEVDDED